MARNSLIHSSLDRRKGIRKQYRESLHVFKTLANTGHGDNSFVHIIGATTLDRPLVDYFTDLASTDFAWITQLTICGVSWSAAELKQLSVLPNLQSLLVSHSGIKKREIAFDDSVLKHMSWQAASEGAFSRLDTLMLDVAPGITARAFQCMSHFPALDTFCVWQSGFLKLHHRQIASLGWEIRSE